MSADGHAALTALAAPAALAALTDRAGRSGVDEIARGQTPRRRRSAHEDTVFTRRTRTGLTLHQTTARERRRGESEQEKDRAHDPGAYESLRADGNAVLAARAAPAASAALAGRARRRASVGDGARSHALRHRRAGDEDALLSSRTLAGLALKELGARQRRRRKTEQEEDQAHGRDPMLTRCDFSSSP